MKALSICPTCSGFVPDSAACPHCRVAPPAQSPAMRVLKRSLRFVAAGAMTVTIAACYGAPCEGDCIAEPIESIAVSGGDTVAVGSNLQLSAIATLEDATAEDITYSAVWSTNSSGIAAVNGGLVTGISVGSAVITASQDSASGFTTVTVTASMIDGS